MTNFSKSLQIFRLTLCVYLSTRAAAFGASLTNFCSFFEKNRTNEFQRKCVIFYLQKYLKLLNYLEIKFIQNLANGP